MNSQRGAANIAAYNKSRLEENLHLVEEELKKCKKRKTPFNSFGILAEYLL